MLSQSNINIPHRRLDKIRSCASESNFSLYQGDIVGSAFTVPLNSLKVFEAAARLGSFKLTAKELNVTQSSISRQVALLEDYLGIKLFDREVNPIKLTSAGKEYASCISESMLNIYRRTQELRTFANDRTIHLSLDPTFASKWFMPRLPEFLADNPKIDVNITTPPDPLYEFRQNNFLSIFCTNESQSHKNSKFLFSDYLQPMCTNDYKEDLNISYPEDLRRCRLLRSPSDAENWPLWLSRNGIADSDGLDYLDFPFALTHRAAVSGLGVIVGSTTLLEEELTSGCLSPLFKQTPSGYSYHLFVDEHRSRSRSVRTFSRWIQSVSSKMERTGRLDRSAN